MTSTRPKRQYLTGAARTKTAADLKVRYEAGATVHELAAEVGKSYGAVARLLRQAGAEMRPVGFQPKTTT
jgi:predicted transcriptional regulator